MSDVATTKNSDWFSAGRFALLLAVIIAMVFPGVLIGREAFFYRDFGLAHLPCAWFVRDSFLHGAIPLWNPYNNCGIPFLAEWNTMALYPPSLIYVLLPLPWSLAAFNLAHLFFAGLGMYLLARRWTGNGLAAGVAGLAYASSGLMLHSLMWSAYVAGLAWIPWVMLAMDRAWRDGGWQKIVLAGAAGAMQLLTGAAEPVLFTWLMLGLFWAAQMFQNEVLRRALVGRFLGAWFVAGGLAAAQMLPFVDLLLHSQRESAAFGESRWAMPGWGWANFIVPLFRCSPSMLGVYSQNEQQLFSSYYLGIGTLAFAVAAILRPRDTKVWLLAGIAAVGVLLAMGENGFVYGAVKQIFPPLRIIRFPVKFVILTAFAVPLLAAFAWKQYFATEESSSSRKRLWLVGVGLLLALCGIVSIACSAPFPDEKPPVTIESGITRAIFLVMIFGVATFITRARSIRATRVGGVAIILLIVLDGITHTPNQNPTVSPTAYETLGIQKDVTARYGEARALVDPRLYAFLTQGAVPDAFQYFTGVRRALFMDCNLPEKIPVAGGFFPLYLRDAAKVDAWLNNPTNVSPGPLADFIGASQVSSPGMPVNWTNRPNHLPLITGGQRVVFAAADDTFKAITSPEFDPRTTVYLPPEARGAVATNASATKISDQKFAAHRIDFAVEATQPTIVVVAQSHYHPWHAYVDGKRVTLWKANYAFQALEVPAGRHEVRLVYEDWAFRAGAGISVTTFALALTGWIRTRKRTTA